MVADRNVYYNGADDKRRKRTMEKSRRLRPSAQLAISWSSNAGRD